MIAIPIAKSYGLKVYTNGNVKNKDKVLEIGADRFIDYKKEDYTKVIPKVDFVLDTLGDNETEKQFSILKEGGHLISLKGIPNGEFAKKTGLPLYKQILFKLAGGKLDSIAKKTGSKYDFVFVKPNGKKLEQAAKILESRNVRPLIDKVYDLEDVNSALKKVENGSSRGKTLIKVN